jgi:hypothetical protein
LTHSFQTIQGGQPNIENHQIGLQLAGQPYSTEKLD